MIWGELIDKNSRLEGLLGLGEDFEMVIGFSDFDFLGSVWRVFGLVWR